MAKLIAATDETLTFSVSSHSRPENHYVDFDIDNGWVCTCEQYYYRKLECKHIQECKDFLLQERDYSIVGVGYHHIIRLTPNAIRHIVNMGTFNEIKQWRQKECKYIHFPLLVMKGLL